VPICLEAALEQRPHVTIFGTDYPTPDGTCIRDYLHVEDLVDAHVAAIAALEPGAELICNVGIGRGHSVREVVEACRRVTGVAFEVREGARRPGDPPQLYNDPSHQRNALGWSASMTDLDAIIASAWAWKQDHPEGYPGD
jgi:UDP-glucose 4-epimerase